MTLLYGLSSAPASQPRNTVIGQATSLAIAIVIREILRSIVPDWVWLRQSLATALAVSFMVRFGFTHPPAGAAAYIFATKSDLRGQHVGVLLVANMVSDTVDALHEFLTHQTKTQIRFPS